MAGILNIQISSTIGKPEVNLKKIEHFVEKNSDKKLDLVVMPEFFSTGVDDKAFAASLMDENGGEVVEFLKNLAKKYNTNIIAGTVIEKSDDKLYNTSFAISRSGETVGKYRKIHLFDYMGGNEGKSITAGDKEVVIDFDFGRVGMSICFDIRYPLHFKKLAKMGAEIIISPSAWLVPNEIYNDSEALRVAQEMWIAMNRTRAYDNGVYFVTSDQTGACNPYFSGIGTSLIISPTAQILANAKDKQCAVYAEIDLDAVKYLKSIYPIAQID